MKIQERVCRKSLDIIMKGMTVIGRRIKETPAELGMDYEEIDFNSRGSEFPLKGWLCRSKGGKCVIIVQGGIRNRANSVTGLLEIAKELTDRGIDVFSFDLRAHGESKGKWNSSNFGQEYEDVLGAFDCMAERFDTSQIGLLGFSLGAGSAILAAFKEEKIRAVVADSSWAESKGVFKDKIWQQRNWFICLHPIVKGAGVKFPNLLEVVKDIKAEILFVHGGVDKIIPPEESHKLVDRLPKGKQHLQIFPGAFHCQSYRSYSSKYINLITEFFNTYLGSSRQ